MFVAIHYEVVFLSSIPFGCVSVPVLGLLFSFLFFSPPKFYLLCILLFVSQKNICADFFAGIWISVYVTAPMFKIPSEVISIVFPSFFFATANLSNKKGDNKKRKTREFSEKKLVASAKYNNYLMTSLHSSNKIS
jgi:hypothetical protein